MKDAKVQITVKVSRSMIQDLPASPFVMMIPEATTIHELMMALSEQFKHQPSALFANCLVAINETCIHDRDTLVHNGDTIFLLAPISGG